MRVAQDRSSLGINRFKVEPGTGGEKNGNQHLN